MTAINFSLSEEIWQRHVAYEAELSKSGLIFTTDSFIYIHSFFGFLNLAIPARCTTKQKLRLISNLPIIGRDCSRAMGRHK